MFSDWTSSVAIGHSNSNPSLTRMTPLLTIWKLYRVVVCTTAMGPNLETFIRKHGEA